MFVLVLRGILYTGIVHPGNRHIHPPDSLMGGYNITEHLHTTEKSLSLCHSPVHGSAFGGAGIVAVNAQFLQRKALAYSRVAYW